MADDPYERQVREGCERAAALAARIAAEGVDAVGRQLRRAWIETELPSRCLDTWATIWEAVRDGDARAAVMTGRERKRLDRLPERVTVYRGSTAGGERGWSWTLERDIAEDFAQRHTEDDPAGLDPIIVEATVDKSDVIAYFEAGGEHEVILDPRRLADPLRVGVAFSPGQLAGPDMSPGSSDAANPAAIR